MTTPNPSLMNQVSAITARKILLLRIVAFIFTFCFFITNSFAANINWQGDVSSAWNNANNWAGNVIPGANDVTINPANYTYAPIISVASTVGNIKKITVSGGGVLTIQANITAADDITVTGANSRIDMTAGTVSFSVGNKDIILAAGGVINLSGGSLSSTGLVTLTNSTFNVSGSATLSVGSTLRLTSSSANSLFNMTGGTVTVATAIDYAAATSTFSATISVSGGTFTNSGTTDFGNSENDLTPFNVSGGTVTLTGAVAENGSGNITFNVSGSGSLIFQNALTMDATDVFTQTGGTVTFQGGNRTWTNAGTLNSTSGDVIFNDATATVITGAGSWNFNNVTINASKVWTGTNPANINIAGNWTNSGGTFNEGTKRVTFNGTSDQTITGAETFYDLTINKSSGKIILANNVIASNSLTMTQGNIDAGANKITVGTSTANTGTLNYTSGSVIGKYEKWLSTTAAARVFPVGTATAYRPATTIFTNLTSGSLIVQFIASNPGSSGLPLVVGGANITNQFTEGYWDFTAANSLASTNYEVQLTGTGFTSYTINSNTRIIKRTNSGTAWILDGTHQYPTGSTARRTALSGISTAQFGLGTTTCTAPTATVAQNNTNEIAQGSTNNEIIRIAVSAYGTTCLDNVTQFNFNTTGSTAAASDISNAKVYYTGTSSTFATGTLFGSLGSAPNGAFSITGSQTLTNDLEYFWLSYDIATAATRTNVVDAQFVSFVVAGNTNTSITNGNPAGIRIIKADRYAVATGNWNTTTTWAYVSGGTPGASVPTSVNDVYIESGYTVTVNSSGITAKNISMTAGAARNLLRITTGGTITCTSINLSTTSKRPELYVDNNGQLTVNGSVVIDYANCTEDAVNSFWITGTAQVNITGNLDLVNTSAKKLIMLQNGSSVVTVGGNITFNNNTNDKAHLAMGGTARLNLAGNLIIPSGKYGKLYNDDALNTTVINFNGTSAQTLELNTSASNSNQWQYSNVYINNTAGVTMNGSVVAGATYDAIAISLVVQTGTLNSGGFNIQLPSATTSLFEVQNGTTYVTTTTGSYGGIAYFGANAGNGKITFGATSTINFAATSAQVIPALSGVNGTPYGHVILSGSGTKTITNAHHANFSAATPVFDINGNLTISNGATLDVSTNNYGITAAGNWTDQNASTGAGFTRRSGTVTFDGTGTQTIALTAPQTFYNFTTSKASGDIAITGNAIVANTLTMSCNFSMSGMNKLTLGTSTASIGTLNYTAGTVIGKFERWLTSTGGTARLFPVGTATSYRPVTFTATTIVGGSLIGEFISGDPGSSGLSLTEGSVTVANQFTEGYWDFTAANSLTSTNYRMDVTATGFTSYSIEGNTRIIKRTNSGSAWALQGTHIDASGSIASRSALNGIATAQFGLGRSTCPASTATVTQPTTTDVWQSIAGNEIIRIAVNSSASACTQNITQFNFTTAGTPGCSAAATDLANARVYYTGTSSTFATTTLFGTLGSAPNGAFVINGTQTITSNTVYFWLTYEIAGTSTVNNVVDGQLVSYVMGGTTVSGGSLTTPNPAGSRTIKGVRYAVATGNWNATSTWAYTSGGSSGASVPTSSTDVYIESGRTVTDNSSAAVAKNIYIQSGGTKAQLIITTGGSLTCSSISMTTTNKKFELYVQQTGALTVNGNVSIDYTTCTENLSATTGIQINNSATVTINGNLTLTNPTGKKLYMVMNGTSITTVTGNVSLAADADDRAFLGMGGTARLNVKGSFGIAATKHGELYNTDALYTSIINFNGSSAQTLNTYTTASSNEWLYSIVWCSNPSGVTLGGNIVDATDFNSIRKSLYVKSGTLKTGGYSITLDNLATALFQVDNGATFYTTTADGYGGIPIFGTNQNNGKITLGATSTVTFAGASQTVPILSGVDGSGYGNVIIAGTGTKTLGRPHHADFSGTGAWDVNGNLTTSSGVVLDASASNYDITLAGNWTEQHAVAGSGFVERSGTVTFDGGSTETITPTATPMTFYNMTVNKSAGTLNLVTSDIVVSNTLTMTAGNINCGASRKITLGTGTGSTGTLTYTAGTIIGKFQRWLSGTGNKLFPMGISTYYRSANINFSQLTAGTLEVEFLASSASNTGLPLSENSITVGSSNILTEGYWRCTAANSLASTNYSVTLTTAGFTSRIISSNTRVIKRANSGSSWTLNGTHVAATATTVGRSALSGFSEFAVVTANCVPSVTASITVTSHACNNTSGALTLSTTNAQAPVGYTWNNGATTQNLSNLSSGNYTVTVLDYNNCTATATASVGVTSATMTVTHQTNYDTPDGAINLSAGGGTGPYTYLWNDQGADITTEDRTSLQSGWYVVTITDVSGCKYVKSAMLAYMDTIHAGSYIVNMGVSPQTIGNGLKPFGFINDMIRNQHVPVNWVINPDKAQYGVDFELNGNDYKGGPFIVEAEYIDNVIDNRITYWETRGVVGDYTTSDIVVPVYAKITGFSNLGIDEQNEGIVIPYFNNAEVPTNIYYVGLPSTLGACDNAYVLPHADPTWANHYYLKDFVLDGGYVWSGCHAVSMLEGISNPGNSSDRMNFLSQTGLQCYSSGKCGSIGTVHAGTPTTPYTYDNTLGAHPLMQFMNDLTPATTGGSEKWYIPVTTGGWNIGAYKAITTADGSYGKEGVKLVFGNGFDDKDNGLVMYEGGHSLNGSGVANVAAQRTFFNFILHSGISKRLIASITAPTSMAEGTGAAVSVSITSGGAPFTYQWTTNVNGSFANSTAASTTFNLTKGNGRPYARITVAVTDACGRIYYETKTIQVLYAAGPIVSYYNGYNIRCNGGSDGTITVAGLGGTPPYSYEWGHGATTAAVTGLSAGDYTVTITDAVLLAVYDTISLAEPPTAVTDSAVSTGTILCYGDSTGSIDMTVSGGLLPYDYSWSSGQVTEDISNLPTGIYDVTVTDANGCYAVTNPPLGIGPDSLTIMDSIVDVTCNGGSDGSINLTVSGATDPYTYSWSTGGSASSIAGISNGDFFVTVTDSNACEKTDSFTVGQATVLNLSTTPTNILCNGASTGAIDLSVSGGTAPYTYVWSGSETSQDISGKAAGNYIVTVTDDNGCTATTNRTLTQPAGVSGSSSITHVICNGGSNGAVDFTPSGGNSPYTYVWSSGPTTQDISGRTAGTYTVTITDANSCTGTHAPVITQPAVVSANPVVTNTTCPYSTNGSVNITPAGGTGTYTFVWSTGATTEDISGRPTGSYSVTVTDANSCTVSALGTIASASNIASTLFILDVSVHAGSNGQVTQTLSGGIAPYSYAWSNSATTKDITGIIAGNYTVTITDANSCTLTKSATVDEPGACPCAWLGTTSDDWNDGTNWDCGFVPTDTCDVVVQAAANTCTIWGGNASCRGLTINAGINLVIINTATLNIYGNLVNNGTIVRNSSTLKFMSVNAQTISGASISRFHNLHINNASATGVYMTDNIEVFNELRLINGYLFTGTDTVKMMSPAQGMLNTFSASSFVVGRLCRKISNAQNFGYEFPVGDAGAPTRYFKAYIKSYALQGTTCLTVWFDTLRQHSDAQLISTYYNPPTNINTYYNYTVPYVKVVNGDTTYSTTYGNTSVTGLIGGVTGQELTTASSYVNSVFTMGKAVETDGFIYSHMASEGIWHFEPDQQPTGGFYHMVLSIANFSGLSDNNFGVLKRPEGTNGTYWSAGGGKMKPFFGTGRVLAHGIAMREYLTTFSEGGVGGGGGNGLPIELLDFKAELVKDDVELTWVTATEINNDYFTIEKSDGENFKQIAIIPGAGNSSSTKYYSKIDYEPFSGTSYYRLKQTDYDGKFTYSDVVSVTYQPADPGNEEDQLLIFPNPSGGNFSVVVKNATEKVTLTLFDNRGKLVMTESYAADEDNDTHQVMVKGIPSGVYYLKADMGEKIRYTKKLMLFSEK